MQQIPTDATHFIDDKFFLYSFGHWYLHNAGDGKWEPVKLKQEGVMRMKFIESHPLNQKENTSLEGEYKYFQTSSMHVPEKCMVLLETPKTIVIRTAAGNEHTFRPDDVEITESAPDMALSYLRAIVTAHTRADNTGLNNAVRLAGVYLNEYH